METLLTLCLFGLGYVGYIDPEFFTLPAMLHEKPVEKPDFARFDDQAELERLRNVFYAMAIPQS